MGGGLELAICIRAAAKAESLRDGADLDLGFLPFLGPADGPGVGGSLEMSEVGLDGCGPGLSLGRLVRRFVSLPVEDRAGIDSSWS